MKKIFTIALFAAGLTFTASAQNRNDRYNNQDHYQVNQSENRNYSGQQQSQDYAYNDRRQPNGDYSRQDDHMNQGYDKRNDGYGNDRSPNRYERNGRIQQTEQGRQQKAKSFGTGVVVGGIAVVLLAALLSHGQ